MKLQIEVPDGFLGGELVFLEESAGAVKLSTMTVDTDCEARGKLPGTMPKQEKQLVPWEAD